MKKNGIGHLRFIAGIDRKELDTFISVVAGKADAEELSSTEHIRIGKVEISGFDGQSDNSEFGGHSSDGTGTELSLEDIPAIELTRLAEVYYAVRRNERLKPSGISAPVSELINAFKREGESILVLAALREQDEYTFTHATNVCILTMAQAMSLGIQGQMLNDIGIAAILHDIGKMFVPEEILVKPDKLTTEEFEIMKMHPVKGGRYLLETPGIPKLAAIVAYEHHMNNDLSGYPVAPTGWCINLASQLTAISDIFDAMRTRRPYKEPRPTKDIANLLLYKSNKEFNPVLIRNFLQIMSRLDKI
jgi:HD-GYP domain-containing protein (c-di-GMP phosphodiesterase class II)